MSTDYESARSTGLLAGLPGWSFVMAGLTYMSGFLIVSTFLSRVGLAEPESELLKVKYFHVGILFLLFPLCVCLPMFAVLYRKFHSDGNTGHPVYSESVYLIINLVFSLYIFLLFAPPNFFREREHVIIALLAGTLVLLFLVRWVGDALKKQGKWETYREVMQWAVLTTIALTDLWAFKGLYGRLWQIFARGAYRLVIFMVIIGVLFWLTRDRTQDPTITPLRRTVAWTITLGLVGALYFYSILTFAYFVYPFIPQERGGGDLLSEPGVIVCFRDSFYESIPAEVRAEGAGNVCSRPLHMIERTGTAVFVFVPPGTLPAAGPAAPAVQPIELPSDAIASIRYVRAAGDP